MLAAKAQAGGLFRAAGSVFEPQRHKEHEEELFFSSVFFAVKNILLNHFSSLRVAQNIFTRHGHLCLCGSNARPATPVNQPPAPPSSSAKRGQGASYHHEEFLNVYPKCIPTGGRGSESESFLDLPLWEDSFQPPYPHLIVGCYIAGSRKGKQVIPPTSAVNYHFVKKSLTMCALIYERGF